MDACSDPLVREVTCMFAAQIGKTEGMINNTVGYYMDQDPSPILAVFESEEKAEAWSKERLMPMLLDTPCLTNKIQLGKGPDSANTIVYKDFPGGYLAIAGAGSEADLSSRPIRILLKDELDKWKHIKAGDPDPLADKRTSTFFNKKIVNVSTPRDTETSRVLRKYKASSGEQWHVPCPFCGHEQVLREGQLKFDREHSTSGVITKVWYECEQCRREIDHRHKRSMNSKGRWISQRPEVRDHRGFHLSALASPWVTWREYAEAFLSMKRQVDTFKTFVNEWRADTWDEQMGSEKEVSPYLARREHYEKIPVGGAIVCASVDVQNDRLECLVGAYGVGREFYGLDHKIFYGKPHQLSNGYLPEVWKRLDEYLSHTWDHESGTVMPIMSCLVDMGYLTTEVVRFCKPRRGRNIFPSKGIGDPRKELIGRASRNTRDHVRFFPVGVNACKEIVFANLDLPEPGPGYCHFNQNFDEEFFKQLLTSERSRWVKGAKVYEKVSTAARNEGLDLMVYNLAAFELLRVNPEARVLELKKRNDAKAGAETGRQPEHPEEPEDRQDGTRRTKPSWTKGWKR